jgi:hypothetical protein
VRFAAKASTIRQHLGVIGFTSIQRRMLPAISKLTVLSNVRTVDEVIPPKMPYASILVGAYKPKRTQSMSRSKRSSFQYPSTVPLTNIVQAGPEST